MAKSKMNKNKIFTSAKKIFKTRDELDQEEVLDIEQQDIAQEIEQLRAEIKAFYLEHPDKDPSMPDKIYVKDMNELEEKITEHIPKKVVEDEIVIKNIIEQDGPSGSNPLDFSRMKEYELPNEYRSQVFSPDIVESDIDQEPDTVVERSDEQSNADTIRDLFGEELYQGMGNAEEEEPQNIVVEDEVNNITAKLNSINDSLDQDLLKQLQELRKEEDQGTELKNRVFTHQGSSKSKSIAFGEEAEQMEQEDQEKLVEQMDEETQSMSDLLSRLLSEGKLEADLHSEDNQEDNGDIYIPGLDLESKENEEAEEEEGESIEITDPRSEVDLDNVNTEESEEVHDSNLSDLLSNLLPNNQTSEKDESPEADKEAEDDNTEEYRNRVFISSVKAIKNMPQSEETWGDGKAGEQGNEEAGNKPGETVIFQEYGENEEEQIEINLGGLDGESLEKQDISVPVSNENSLKEEMIPEFGAEGKTNQMTKGEEESSDDSEMKSDMTQSDIPMEDKSMEEISEESTASKEAFREESENSDDITENLSPEESREEQVQFDKYRDESKIISGDNADEILKVEIEERKSLSEEKEETDSDSLVNNSFLDDETTDQLGVMEDILNSLLGESEAGIDKKKEIESEEINEPVDQDLSVMTESELNKKINADEQEEQLKGKLDSNINSIEDILNSLMEETQAGQSDLGNSKKQNIEKQIIENKSMVNLEHIDDGKDSAEEIKSKLTKPVSAEKSLEEGISAYFQEDHVPGRNNVIHKKIADPVAVVVPEKKKIVGKVTKEEKIKKPAVNKKPEENITKEVSKEKVSNEKISKEQKQISAEIVKADSSSHAVKVLTEEKRQNLLSRLIQKIKELFKKKPKMEIVSQDAVMEESNVYKGQEKETFINGLITGSVSGDNVTLNPLAVVKKDVIAQGKVLCLSGAAIMGKVSCDSIIVEGTVFGEIEARGKVIIKNDALVLGNIYSSDVRITQGAMVQGDIFFKSPERKGK